MNKNRMYSRQLDLITPDELDFPILVIGAGGIGSWTTLALAKMGCTNITVIDNDIVSEENIPSQLYAIDFKGVSKVEALKQEVYRKTATTITKVNNTFQIWALTHTGIDYKIIIFAVDSLVQRKEIFTYMVSQKIYTDLLIDARMAGELIRILTVDGMDTIGVINYFQTLDDSKKPYEEPCTSKAVIYNTLLCGGLIASIVKKFAKKESIKSNIVFDITNLQIF